MGYQTYTKADGTIGTMVVPDNQQGGSFSGNFDPKIQQMHMTNQLTATTTMGKRELDNHFAVSGNFALPVIYLSEIETKWDNYCANWKLSVSQESLMKRDEYLQILKHAEMESKAMAGNGLDIDSATLLKKVTLQPGVVNISTFIHGLLNDINLLNYKLALLSEDTVNSSLEIAKRETLKKIREGRMNEIMETDVQALEKVIFYDPNVRVELNLVLITLTDILRYMTLHYAHAVQALQNLAHMPTETGAGLIMQLSKMLHVEQNMALMYNSTMAEADAMYKETETVQVDMNEISYRAQDYMAATPGLTFDVAYARAKAELESAAMQKYKTDMAKYHNAFIAANEKTLSMAPQPQLQVIYGAGGTSTSYQPGMPTVLPPGTFTGNSGMTALPSTYGQYGYGTAGGMMQPQMMQQQMYQQPVNQQMIDIQKMYPGIVVHQKPIGVIQQPQQMMYQQPTQQQMGNTLPPHQTPITNSWQTGQGGTGGVEVYANTGEAGRVMLNGKWYVETYPGSGSYIESFNN